MTHALGIWLLAAAATTGAPANDELPPSTSTAATIKSPNPDLPASDAAKSATATATSTAATPPPRSPRQLREAVHQAMVRSAKPGPDRASAIRQLAELHDEIVADQQMPDEDREALERAVRSRLKKLKDEITKTTGPKNTLAQNASAKNTVPENTGPQNTGQQAAGRPVGKPVAKAAPKPSPPLRAPSGSGTFALGGAAGNEGQELVDLIERTIAPQTWDTNGGPGAIRYFGQTHSIVVRGTQDAHDELGELIRALEK